MPTQVHVLLTLALSLHRAVISVLVLARDECELRLGWPDSKPVRRVQRSACIWTGAASRTLSRQHRMKQIPRVVPMLASLFVQACHSFEDCIIASTSGSSISNCSSGEGVQEYGTKLTKPDEMIRGGRCGGMQTPR